MGVKTKAFGPPAWIVFEGIASMIDTCLSSDHFENKDKMRRLALEFFTLLGFVVPCIYCRISYQMFTDPVTCDSDMSIHRLLMLMNGAQRYVYNLHNCVNNKLKKQELERHWRSADLDEIQRRWSAYTPTFSDVLERARQRSVVTQEWWLSLITLLSYVMCDYRAEECQYIYRFFIVLGELFSLVPGPRLTVISKHYIDAIKRTSKLWDANMDLSTRFDIVWSIRKYVFTSQQWSGGPTRRDLESECKAQIVGCATAP